MHFLSELIQIHQLKMNSMLLQLFPLFCFKCKQNNATATMKANGTMVTVTQSCSRCQGVFTWNSQPPPILGKYPIGNVLLSFSILVAGASINKGAADFSTHGTTGLFCPHLFQASEVLVIPCDSSSLGHLQHQTHCQD